MHKNARLTPKGREVLVQRLEAGQRVSEVAQALGISETTARKWWRRHQAGEGLQDRSSRPRVSPRRTSAELREIGRASCRERVEVKEGEGQAEDGIRDFHVTGVQTCALPI